jgi:hypothetical protein
MTEFVISWLECTVTLYRTVVTIYTTNCDTRNSAVWQPIVFVFPDLSCEMDDVRIEVRFAEGAQLSFLRYVGTQVCPAGTGGEVALGVNVVSPLMSHFWLCIFTILPPCRVAH